MVSHLVGGFKFDMPQTCVALTEMVGSVDHILATGAAILTKLDTEQIDSEIFDTSLEFILVDFVVLLLMGAFILGCKLMLLVVPGSAFFGGMLFSFVAMSVWTVTVSTGLYTVITIACPRPTALFLNMGLVLTTVIVWVWYAWPYPSYSEAMLDTVSQLCFAIVSPTMWYQYRLVYKTLRLSTAPPPEPKADSANAALKKPFRP